MISIAGIDASKNSPAVVKFTLGSDYKIIGVEYLAFTDKKKIAEVDSRVVYYKKSGFAHDYEQSAFMYTHIIKFLDKKVPVSICAFEDYAVGGAGKIIDLAEVTGTLKYKLYEKGVDLRLYSIGSVKKFFTGLGNAKKLPMGEAFYNFTAATKPDLSKLPVIDVEKDIKPTSDIVDAYAITWLLYNELLLRNGYITMRDLDTDEKLLKSKIEVFNSVSSKYPENILTRPFMKGRVNE